MSKGTSALSGSLQAALGSGPEPRHAQDRISQTLMYEAGGLIVVSPLFSYSAGVSAATSAGLLVVLAVVVAVWTAAFNTLFDPIELQRTGTADQRPTWRRVLQAGLLESGIIVVTTPVIVVWTRLGWFDALALDAGLTAASLVYAYFFELIYDRAYPLSEARHD